MDGVAADVSTAGGCSRAIAAHPQVDVLVNNMGIFEPKRFEDISDEEWLRSEVVSLIAYVCSAKASATTGAALRVDGGVVRAIV